MTNATEQSEALAELRDLLPSGTTVYTILRHCAASGMTRWISAVVVTPTATGFADHFPIRELDYLIARTGIAKRDRKHEGLKRVGCGMDMGFDLVHSLSLALHEDGYALNHRWL